jgi:phospholipase A1
VVAVIPFYALGQEAPTVNTTEHSQSASPDNDEDDNSQEIDDTPPEPSVLRSRLESDRIAIANNFAITQHRQNYILPVSYVTNPNSAGNSDLTEDNIDNTEAKYQISVKLPLALRENSTEGLYLGFTLKSFWQLYNSEVSKPFRETNYEPEIFYQWNSSNHFLGLHFNAIQLGFNHMSNGQSGTSSRSWNRITASILFSDSEDVYYFKTWYRIPEDAKEYEDDPAGDDNPDIQSYYGRVELGYGARFKKFTLLTIVRNNLSLSSNRGSIELNLSYPISKRYEALLQYFNGYGDSLIDYNRSQERIGLGIQMTLF